MNCNTQTLTRAVRSVCQIMPKRFTYPVLANIRLTPLEAESRLRLDATDLDSYLSVTLPATGNSLKPSIILGHKLRDYLSEVTAPEVDLSTTNLSTLLSGQDRHGSFKATFSGLDPAEFPEPPALLKPEDVTGTIYYPAAGLRKALKSMAKHTDKNEKGYPKEYRDHIFCDFGLTASRFLAYKSGFTAQDGPAYRLSTGNASPVLLPPSLAEALPDEGEVEIRIGTSKVELSWGDCKATVRQPEPEMLAKWAGAQTQAAPVESIASLKIRRSFLLCALDQAKVHSYRVCHEWMNSYDPVEAWTEIKERFEFCLYKSGKKEGRGYHKRVEDKIEHPFEPGYSLLGEEDTEERCPMMLIFGPAPRLHHMTPRTSRTWHRDRSWQLLHRSWKLDPPVEFAIDNAEFTGTKTAVKIGNDYTYGRHNRNELIRFAKLVKSMGKDLTLSLTADRKRLVLADDKTVKSFHLTD